MRFEGIHGSGQCVWGMTRCGGLDEAWALGEGVQFPHELCPAGSIPPPSA